MCENCEQESDDYHFCEEIEMDGKPIVVVFETDAILCKTCKSQAIQRALEKMFK